MVLKNAPAERLEEHSGLVVWLTGLSGAGKTTLATAVRRLMMLQGYRTFILDGDALRSGLCCDLGFCDEDRHENVRRGAAVSRLMADAGLICFTALISPFHADRLRARGLVSTERFLEVFVNAPLAVCEQRDVKGLYRRARANEIPNFTGITSPFDPPESPDVEVRTDLWPVEKCAAFIYNAAEKKLRRLSSVNGEARKLSEAAVS